MINLIKCVDDGWIFTSSSICGQNIVAEEVVMIVVMVIIIILIVYHQQFEMTVDQDQVQVNCHSQLLLVTYTVSI